MAGRSVRIGRVAGVELSAGPSALVGSLLLWAGAAAFARFALGHSVAVALAAGVLVVALHWLSALVHQFSHAYAAWRTGFPMCGIRLWWMLSTSLYPPDEPALPPIVHVRRAMGGPTGSAILTAVAGLLLLALRGPVGELWWVLAFFFLDNLLVLTLGAFLPLGFTDGSTLLRQWRAR